MRTSKHTHDRSVSFNTYISAEGVELQLCVRYNDVSGYNCVVVVQVRVCIFYLSLVLCSHLTVFFLACFRPTSVVETSFNFCKPIIGKSLKK